MNSGDARNSDGTSGILAQLNEVSSRRAALSPDHPEADSAIAALAFEEEGLFDALHPETAPECLAVAQAMIARLDLDDEPAGRALKRSIQGLRACQK
ncbi:MAG: hypothetical protein AB7O44_27580 [Hyphomicrobiaceae bacterium]